MIIFSRSFGKRSTTFWVRITAVVISTGPSSGSTAFSFLGRLIFILVGTGTVGNSSPTSSCLDSSKPVSSCLRFTIANRSLYSRSSSWSKSFSCSCSFARSAGLRMTSLRFVDIGNTSPNDSFATSSSNTTTMLGKPKLSGRVVSILFCCNLFMISALSTVDCFRLSNIDTGARLDFASGLKISISASVS